MTEQEEIIKLRRIVAAYEKIIIMCRVIGWPIDWTEVDAIREEYELDATQAKNKSSGM